MNKFTGYRCSLCGKEFDASYSGYVCDADQGNLNVILNYDQIRNSIDPKQIFQSAEPSLWRYTPLLPVQDPGFFGTPLHSAGWTPVYYEPQLAAKISNRNHWIKDE